MIIHLNSKTNAILDHIKFIEFFAVSTQATFNVHNGFKYCSNNWFPIDIICCLMIKNICIAIFDYKYIKYLMYLALIYNL